MGSGASQPTATPAIGRQQPAVIESQQTRQRPPPPPPTYYYAPQMGSHVQPPQVYPPQMPNYNFHQGNVPQHYLPGLYPQLPSDRTESPPPSIQSHGASIPSGGNTITGRDWQAGGGLELDYSLREMTWPPPNNNLLLTDEDIRQGDDFIAEMAEKRMLFDSTQIELLKKLQVEASNPSDDVTEITNLITTLCQMHHFLYGGHEDESGIEFEPASNSLEDNYILEQIDSLSRRHHQELVKSDRLCAIKLLHGRGPEMTEQKLDSIIEEHIKLRSYMRTRQTKDQIAAYIQVQSAIKENPQLYKSTAGPISYKGETKLVTSTADHPIVQRLPPLTRAKLKSIGATRGRTVTVDADGNVTDRHTEDSSSTQDVARFSSRQEEANTYHTQGTVEKAESKSSNHKNPNSGNNFQSASIWNRASSSEESEDDDAILQSKILTGTSTHQVGHSTNRPAAGLAELLRKSGPSNSAVKSSVGLVGFTVVTADPRYIANVSYQPEKPVIQKEAPAAVQQEESQDSDENDDLLRTGVVAGTVNQRINQYSSRHEETATFENSHYVSRKVDDQHNFDIVDYENDFEDDDEDLLAQYKTSLNGDRSGDEDSESVASTEDTRSQVSQENTDSEREQSYYHADQTLRASAQLKEGVAEAIWVNKEDLNQASFAALISLWQEKQRNIEQNEGAVTAGSSTGKNLWRKVKDKLMYDAIKSAGTSQGDSEDEESDGDASSISTSMQTTLPSNQSISVQTDAAAARVDAETLVDEFFVDDKEKKKIKKMDKDLVEMITNNDLTDNELRMIMARNRENVEKLRRQREANRLKSLQLLKDRNAMKYQTDQDEEDAETLDEETERKLDEIEQKVVNKFLKHRSRITDKDMSALLKEARQRQEDILRQRNIEKVRQNEKIRKQLIEKRNAKMKEEQISSKGKKTGDFEAEFFKDLKDKFNSGNLTHEQFKALMEQHLTRLGNASLQAPQEPKNKPTYKAQDSSEDHAMNAQKIITRAHEKSKAIKDVRQRERENAVAELKHKKQMKKKKALA